MKILTPSREENEVKLVKKSNLILPSQPFHEDFLDIMSKVFRTVRLLGIAGTEGYQWKLWGGLLAMALIAIEIRSIIKVIYALTGLATDTARQRSVTGRLAGTIFYTCSLLSLLLCWRFSSKWHQLSSYWVTAERNVMSVIPKDNTLRRRMVTVITVMSSCAIYSSLFRSEVGSTVFSILTAKSKLGYVPDEAKDKPVKLQGQKSFTVEHVMSAVSKIGFDCPVDNVLRRYILRSHGFLMLKTEYSIWAALPLLVMSIIATALWNFLDLLIVLVSMGLTSRYHRLNERVKKICIEHSRVSYQGLEAIKMYTWRNLRQAYVSQMTLVRTVDKSLGGLVVLSAAGNFYFICLQIFLGVSKAVTGGLIIQAYYTISFIWLCVRTTFMVLAAAEINVHSKQALPHIFNYKTSSFNVEIERLQIQLRNDDIALTGLGFFSLHRAILLQMASSIVTYELVLLQFDNSDVSDSLSKNVTKH